MKLEEIKQEWIDADLLVIGGGKIEWEKCIARGDNICSQRVLLTAGSVKDRTAKGAYA